MANELKLPTLFKKASGGALQFWKIAVEENTIYTSWGQIGGTEQTAIDKISSGKNAGRSNATTPAQQARAEAESRWLKQKKNKGYVEDGDAAARGEVDALVEGGVTPMLAHRYDEHPHKIKFPALVQPKLDGHRCIAVVKDGKATLWSRTRKRITGVPHIERELERWFKDVVLDGELYHHDYRSKFEELSSFIRSATPKSGHEVVQYHVYDIVNEDTQLARHEALEELIRADYHPIVGVITQRVSDEDDLMQAFGIYLGEGYEGAMVRNLNGRYVNKRSYDLQKVKSMNDQEFEIVGLKEGRGKMAGKAIFACKTASGLLFDVKMIGSLAGLEELWRTGEKHIGKKLTVRFQNLTADGLPRFPVGVRLHEEL